MGRLGRLAAIAPILALAWAGPVTAQGRPDGGEPRRPLRDEAKKIVQAYLLMNVQESLGLTDEQFVKILPLMKRLLADRQGFAERRGRALHEIRELLASGKATESTLLERMKELRAIESEEPQTLRKDMDALDELLTPVQQAKFRVLEADVDRRIRDLMRPRGNMGNMRGPRRGPSPGEPEDGGAP